MFFLDAALFIRNKRCKVCGKPLLIRAIDSHIIFAECYEDALLQGKDQPHYSLRIEPDETGRCCIISENVKFYNDRNIWSLSTYYNTITAQSLTCFKNNKNNCFISDGYKATIARFEEEYFPMSNVDLKDFLDKAELITLFR